MAYASKKSHATFLFFFKTPAKFYSSKIIEVSSSYENTFLPLGTHHAISVATLQTGYFMIFKLSASTESIHFF